MDEGTLIEWTVVPGQQVRKGDIVAIVDTTKAAVDVESWADGTVHQLLTQPGETVAVGTVMARLLAPGEAAPAALPAAAAPTAMPVPAPAPAQDPMAPATLPAETAAAAVAHLRVSPAARRRAGALGIDIGTVRGTGPEGAVTLEDVEAAATAPTMAAPKDRGVEMRRAIAAAMSRSKREIPHYYLAELVPMRSALQWLSMHNAARPVTARLLSAVLLLKAVAVTLGRFPELNGHVMDGVFRPAAGRLRSSEMSDPTIAVTNLGDAGVESVFGVIYPPQVALVGFGRLSERPCVDDGALVAMPTLTSSLAADHRVGDGHRGGLFLAELRVLLQHPESLQRPVE